MIYPIKLLFWADAFTVNKDLILIHPDHSGDMALIAHELVHQAHMGRIGTWTFWWRYLTSKAFRLESEVEAYKTQIIYGASAIICARHLATDYRLGIDQFEALKLLESP